jgi:hypothetical protein
LTVCITAWYGNCLASDRKTLQKVVCTVQYVTGAELPANQDLYTRRCPKIIIKNSSQPSHGLFSLLPHRKRYRCTMPGINRTRIKSNQIKFIYIALRTSADISKCCTETQPKTPNSKQCRCKSTEQLLPPPPPNTKD